MKTSKTLWVFTGLGFELVGLILLAIFFGQKLEIWVPLNGLWAAVLIIFALFAWIFHIFVLLKRLQ